MIIAMKSYLYMGAFAIPLRKNSHCSSLHHLDLIIGATSRTPETAFPTISRNNFNPETVLVVHASTATEATSLPTPVPANISHKRSGNANGQVMAKIKNIPKCGVMFQTLYRRYIRSRSIRVLNRNTVRHHGLTVPSNASSW